MGKSVTSSLFLAWTAATLLAGCAQTQRVAETPQALTLRGLTVAEAMEEATTVLRRLHFGIRNADAGVVTTVPLTAAQFFEFWRSDNVGLDSTLEANLHTLRRSVRMDFAETADGGVRIRCTIRVQRLSLPENEVASVSQAYRIYSRSTPTMQRLDLNPSQKEAVTWIEMGDDPALAAEILSKIARNIEQPKEDETT